MEALDYADDVNEIARDRAKELIWRDLHRDLKKLENEPSSTEDDEIMEAMEIYEDRLRYADWVVEDAEETLKKAAKKPWGKLNEKSRFIVLAYKALEETDDCFSIVHARMLEVYMNEDKKLKAAKESENA